jgi:hypothetical protein
MCDAGILIGVAYATGLLIGWAAYGWWSSR